MNLNSYSLVQVKYGSTTVPIRDSNVNFGISIFKEGGGANISPSFIALQKQSVTVDLTIAAMRTGYSAFGSYCPVNSTSPIDLIFAKRKEGDIYDTTGGIQIRLNNGEVFLRSITGRSQDIATMSYQITGTYDGTNYPFSVSTYTGSLDTTTQVTERFTSGPAVIDSTVLMTSNSNTFNTGITEFKDSANCSPFDQFVSIQKIEPTGSINSNDLSKLSAISSIGRASTNVALYFCAIDKVTGRSNTGGFKVLFPSAFIRYGTVNGTWTETSGFDIQIDAYHDGVNNVYTIDSSAAIPTS